MGYTFREQSFNSKYEDLQRAIKWLSNVGITYFNSRIDKYLKDIKTLSEANTNQAIQKLLDAGKYPELINSLYEIYELIGIYKGLSRLATTEDITNKLSSFVKGPEFAKHEKVNGANHQARDIAFELFIASIFVLSNFSVDFGTLADLKVVDPSCTFFIECKRPSFDHSVHSNVRGAARQLRTRYKTHKSPSPAYGIIALSIDKVVNPEHFLLVATDENAMDRRMHEEAERFITRFHSSWKTLDDPETIGVIMLFQTVAIPENHNMITSCNFLFSNNITHSQSTAGKIFRSTVERLREAVLDIHEGKLTVNSI